MWSYTNEESDWLARRAGGPDGAGGRHPLPEEISFYITRGQRLRAEALVAMAGRLRDWVRRRFGRGPDPAKAAGVQPPPEVTGEGFVEALASGLKTPLTSIRTSAEILRDNPDLPLEKRNRFLDVVLEEDARLDHLISQILADSDYSERRRRWRVRTGKLSEQLGRRAA